MIAPPIHRLMSQQIRGSTAQAWAWTFQDEVMCALCLRSEPESTGIRWATDACYRAGQIHRLREDELKMTTQSSGSHPTPAGQHPHTGGLRYPSHIQLLLLWAWADPRARQPPLCQTTGSILPVALLSSDMYHQLCFQERFHVLASALFLRNCLWLLKTSHR